MELAEEVVQEERPFVPPVSVQLRVVGADHDRRPVHPGRQVRNLLLPVHPEVLGVLARALARDVRVVDPLVVQLVVGDRVVLDPGVDAVPVRVDVGADVVHRQVVADVAIEVAVVRIAGVAFLRAPDLHRGLDVAGEGRDTRAAVDGGVRAVDGGRIGVEQSVGVDEEVADSGLAQELVDGGHVAALAEPHAGRPAAEVLLVEIRGHVHLRPDRRPVAIHQREEGVRGGGGDHLQPAGVAQLPERAHQIAVVAAPGVAQRQEAIAVHPCQPLVVGLGLRADDLLLAELDQLVEVRRVARLQQVVRHHADQRGRERDGAPVGHAVRDQALEDLQQRQVRARDRFVEPHLFQHVRPLRVADEGQVSVEDDGEESLGHQ